MHIWINKEFEAKENKGVGLDSTVHWNISQE